MSRNPDPNKPFLETATTRAPETLYSYAKAIAAVKFGTVLAMTEEMMARFLDDEPWTKGLRFRECRSVTGRLGTRTYVTGWQQVTLRLRPDLMERIKIAAEESGVSVARFIFTALYWWTWYIYPPKSEVERREKIEKIRAEARRRAREEEAQRQAREAAMPPKVQRASFGVLCREPW